MDIVKVFLMEGQPCLVADWLFVSTRGIKEHKPEAQWWPWDCTNLNWTTAQQSQEVHQFQGSILVLSDTGDKLDKELQELQAWKMSLQKSTVRNGGKYRELDVVGVEMLLRSARQQWLQWFSPGVEMSVAMLEQYSWPRQTTSYYKHRSCRWQKYNILFFIYKPYNINLSQGIWQRISLSLKQTALVIFHPCRRYYKKLLMQRTMIYMMVLLLPLPSSPPDSPVFHSQCQDEKVFRQRGKAF